MNDKNEWQPPLVVTIRVNDDGKQARERQKAKQQRGNAGAWQGDLGGFQENIPASNLGDLTAKRRGRRCLADDDFLILF